MVTGYGVGGSPFRYITYPRSISTSATPILTSSPWGITSHFTVKSMAKPEALPAAVERLSLFTRHSFFVWTICSKRAEVPPAVTRGAGRVTAAKTKGRDAGSHVGLRDRVRGRRAMAVCLGLLIRL